MDHGQACINHPLQMLCGRLTRFGAVLLLVAIAWAAPCRADSGLQHASPGNSSVRAVAHLDFRITVLPSMGLSMQTNGARISGSGGTLTLQREAAGALPGSAPTASIQLQPRRLVVETTLPTAAMASNELITIASP